MAIFNSYVSLPEGTLRFFESLLWKITDVPWSSYTVSGLWSRAWQMSFSQRSSDYIFFGCYLQEILVSGHLDDHPAPVDYGTVMGVVIYG